MRIEPTTAVFHHQNADIHGGAGRGGHTRRPVELSVRDRAILDFERSWWQLTGSKEQGIRARLNMSSTVKRLRRHRDLRRRARYEGRRADPRSR